MTAVTASSETGDFWRPSAPAAPPLLVAHRLRSDRCLAATVLAVICPFALLVTAAPTVSSLNRFGAETGVAAQTDLSTTGVGLEAAGTAAVVGGNGPYAYDGSLGCCVAPRTARHLCSFSGETEVLMADGATKPISEIEVGDFVLAEDPETGERGEREVTHLWVHQDMIIDLEIDGHDVATTEDHPFWNDTDGEWQRADALDRGDLLVTAGGATLIVDGMDWGSARTTTAYNLTVDGVHTYFVAVGDEPVLVHNVCFDDVVTTSHGRQRLAEAGFDDLSVDLLRASDTVYEQADGALVHVAQSGPDAFDFIVIGENGIVTAHRGFTRWELDGLAFNHDCLGYP